MNERIYLDCNATAPLREEARDAMLSALATLGNPSSVHTEGRSARELVERARGEVARLLGAAPRNVVFTSGGTEANALALAPGIARSGQPVCRRLLVSAIEHPSVLSGGRFAPEQVQRVPVGTDGVIDLARLAELLDGRERPSLVSLMLANNETGVLQPVAAAAAVVRAAGGLLHVDAVQAAGRIPLDIKALQADLVTISAHKLGGPQGAGALILADEAIHPVALIRGGGQERGHRAGTENVAAIAGFGAAAQAALADLGAGSRVDLQARLQAHLEAGLRQISAEMVIFGTDAPRLNNTTLFALPGIKAETALIALDLEGVAVSSGAACSSGKVTPSHVLAAMGIGEDLAAGAIRVSLGRTSTETDIDGFLKAWRTLVSRLNNASKRGRRGIAA